LYAGGYDWRAGRTSGSGRFTTPSTAVTDILPSRFSPYITGYSPPGGNHHSDREGKYPRESARDLSDSAATSSARSPQINCGEDRSAERQVSPQINRGDGRGRRGQRGRMGPREP
jgi:hypothetical protein